MDIIWNNVNRDDGEHGLMPESHDMLANVLGPGRILNGMTKLQLENFTDTFEKLSFGIGGQEGKEVDLLDWCRQQFTLANARAIYGPENIFDMHSELVEDFWVFEQGLIGLLADVLPVITARKAHLARRRIIAALVEYVEKESYKKASPMIQHRVAINLKNGITKEMTGHGEMIMMFAILGNAVPTTFWFLANLFSKPKLLQEVRDEIKNAIEVTNKAETGAGVEIRTIHVDMLKAGAPVLVSSFRETLRMVANLTSVRWILEDTIIGDKYLLKKDSIVQVASGVVHMDKETWGAEAAMFNPKRFIITSTETSTPTTVPLPNNVPSAAFRAFGGGSVICPGRHFAQSEIVGFVAAFVMGFDMEKPGGEAFELPARNNEAIPLAVMKPTTSCRVIIKKRQGLENVKWNLDL
jgi:cytochrome P450